MNKEKNLNSYTNKIVKKPWGEEYLIFQNDLVAIWLLNILSEKNTSLHCHPTKKTGLILLDGKVEIDIGFYEKRILEAPDKIMIRPGLFHSTKAISSKITMLEIEVPIDKSDLVRFKDEYGRTEKSYEGSEFISKLNEKAILFAHPIQNEIKKYIFNQSVVTIERHRDTEMLINRNPNTIFSILKGGLVSKSGKTVLSPGDVVRTETIKKLSEVFNTTEIIDILTVSNII